MESKPSTLDQTEVNESKQRADGGKTNSSRFSNIHLEESKKGSNENKKVRLLQTIKYTMDIYTEELQNNSKINL